MEDLVPIFAIFSVFGTITAIIVGPTYLKYREKRDMQETVRASLEKGQVLPEDLVDAMTRDVRNRLPSRTRDLRQGVIWLAVGIGAGLFGLLMDGVERHSSNVVLAASAIPAVIGVAFIILSFFNPNKE